MAALNGYLALGVLSAAGVFTEISGAPGYTRQAISLAPASAGSVQNASTINFPVNSGSARWPAYGAYAVYDAVTGGNVLFAWNIYPGSGAIASRSPLPGRNHTIPAGTIKLEFPAVMSEAGSEVVLSKPFLWTPGGLQRFEESPVTPTGSSVSRALGDVLGSLPARDQNFIQADVIVYGATPSGVLSATQAAKQGRSVVIAGGWREMHLGGMMSGGLGATDLKNFAAIGGMAKEFFARVDAIYGRAAGTYTFEPRIAERAFDSWAAEYGIPVVWTKGVTEAVINGSKRIEQFRTADGKVFRGKVFIDATYEGDLLAKAGVSFFVGREGGGGANGTSGYDGYLTTSAANIAQSKLGATDYPLDPYVTPGVSGSGLISGVSTMPGGAYNSADSKVQAYNFRLTVTNDSSRRIPFSNVAPADYNIANYEALLRYLAAMTADGKVWPTHYNTDTIFQHVPVATTTGGGVFDWNNRGFFSTDYVGGSWAYPTASYAQREVIWKAHENYIRGLLYTYTYANDSRIPAALRASLLNYGWDANHFMTPYVGDSENWPYQLYVREARRMVSDFIYRGSDMQMADGTVPRSTNTIATASYNMDSHIVQRFAASVNGTMRVWNEGAFELDASGADDLAPVPYEVIVPRRTECINLLVTFCVSATHFAFSSLRMEPTLMAIGEAAGMAAAMVAESRTGLAVQDVPYSDLRSRLMNNGTATAPVLPQVN